MSTNEILFACGMDIENLELSEEMTKTGSFAYLSKETINSLFNCTLSCTVFGASIYIIILIAKVATFVQISKLYLTIGYISLICLLTFPLGLYGSRTGNSCGLLIFFLLASYHLYGLIIYIWLNIVPISYTNAADRSYLKQYRQLNINYRVANIDETFLNNITVFLYTASVLLSLFSTVFKIISKTKEIGADKVIVVDNNPVD